MTLQQLECLDLNVPGLRVFLSKICLPFTTTTIYYHHHHHYYHHYHYHHYTTATTATTTTTTTTATTTVVTTVCPLLPPLLVGTLTSSRYQVGGNAWWLRVCKGIRMPDMKRANSVRNYAYVYADIAHRQEQQ